MLVAAESGTEEHDVRPKKRRMVPPTRQLPAPASAMEDMSDGTRAFHAAAAAVVVAPPVPMLSMSGFVHAFPHTSLDSDCHWAVSKLEVAACAVSDGGSKAGARPDDLELTGHAVLTDAVKDLNKVQREDRHFEASQADPAELQKLVEMRAQMVSPTYTLPQSIPTHQQASQLLRAKTYKMECLRARFETDMMVQAGTWEFAEVGVRHLPPCVNGMLCKGQLVGFTAGLTESVTWMRAMTEKQWAALVTRDEQPPGAWPCIVCHRVQCAQYVTQRRLAPRPGVTIVDDDPDAVLQLWYNKVNEPGEYDENYTLRPRVQEVVVAPLAHCFYSAMIASKRPNGQWCINQDLLLYHPPPVQQAQTGESIASF